MQNIKYSVYVNWGNGLKLMAWYGCRQAAKNLADYYIYKRDNLDLDDDAASPGDVEIREENISSCGYCNIEQINMFGLFISQR